MELVLPSHTVIRTHAHPVSFASSILDYIDESPSLKERGVLSSPTQFSQLLVAVELEGGKIGWGIYTLSQYKESIARPGDGNPLPEFQLNFNRAELKLAEASQLLTDKQRSLVFPAQLTQPGGEPLLAVDVGAAPGGWTGYLSSLTTTPVSVIAIDPAS